MEYEFGRYNRVTQTTLDESFKVHVSDADYSSYIPLIWASGNNLNVVYIKNTSDTEESVFANQNVLKAYTSDGKLVSEETLMEVEPGKFGTFQMPFRKLEHGPSSTVVFWADNGSKPV